MEFSSFVNNSIMMDYFDACNDFPSLLLIWKVISVLCFLLGFPVSLMELWELFQRQQQRNINDFFMLSMAAIDFSLTSILLLNVINFDIWRSMAFEHINNFIYCLALSGRPLFMACVCIDCYFAVVHPIAYKTSKTFHAIRVAASVVVWIVSLCTSTLYIGILEFLSLGLCINLFTALPVIVFCDICMLQALRKPDPSGRRNMHPQKKRALHIIINSLIMTCLVYLPPAIIFLSENVVPGVTTNCLFITSAFCFSITGSAIMPILYLESMGKLDTFKQCCKK